MGHDRTRDGLDRLIRSALAGGAASEVGVCPEADAVAAYGDGGLEADERRSLETHLAACPRCQEVLALMVRDAAEPTTASHARPSTSRAWLARLRWAFPAAAVATAAIAYIAVRPDMTTPAGDGQHPPAVTIAGRLDAPRADQPSVSANASADRARAAEPSPPSGAAEGRLESSPVAPPAVATEATPRSSPQPAVAEPAPDAPVVLAGSASSKALPAAPPTVADAVAAQPPPAPAVVPAIAAATPAVQPSEAAATRQATRVEVSAPSRPAVANAAPAKGEVSRDAAVAGTSPWETAFATADVVLLTRALEAGDGGAVFEVVEVFKRPDDLPPAGRIVVTAGAGLVRPGQPYLLFLRRREPAAAQLEPLADSGVVRVGDQSGPLLAFLRQRAGAARREG